VKESTGRILELWGLILLSCSTIPVLGVFVAFPGEPAPSYLVTAAIVMPLAALLLIVVSYSDKRFRH
jgi:hypothetical protein